jgi:putative hydrolase of the HAD superfamily
MPPTIAEVRWILFDAVGTLLYPDPPVAEVYHAIARQFGSQLGPSEIRERFVAQLATEFSRGDTLRGPPTSESGEYQRWRRIVAAVLHDLPNAGGQPFELLWRHFAQPSSWQLFADVPRTLATLDRRGFRLGIASNFDGRLHAIVRALPELAVSQRTFVSSEIGFSKPDPRFFAAVTAQLAARPEQILLVGDDRRNDFEGAIAAGWQAVLIERELAVSGTHGESVSTLADLSGLDCLLQRTNDPARA